MSGKRKMREDRSLLPSFDLKYSHEDRQSTGQTGNLFGGGGGTGLWPLRLASRTRFSMAWAYEPPVLSSLTCLFASSKMFSRCSFRAWRTFRREALSAVDWELRKGWSDPDADWD
jgi:hypothetical protein